MANDKDRKRRRRSSSSSSSNIHLRRHRTHSPPPHHHRRPHPKFITHLDSPNLVAPKIKILCHIISTAHPSSIERSLEDAALSITQSDVEDALKLSYSSPATAVKFFRWAGGQLHDNHSPYAWNLVVDLLALNLSPKIKIISHIISTTHSSFIEQSLEDAALSVTQADVEEALKLSYSLPGTAVKFFRWAGRQLHDNHLPYAWNLVVDLLGKNRLFEAMWDAIKSMRKQNLISLATFASVFSSYVSDNRVQEAIMAFEVMEQYGCPRDIVALNSLLSAICRDGKTVKAKEFLDTAKYTIRPDLDTYAILLEGSENEGDLGSARRTFAEMVTEVGWDPRNIPAYESFLITLVKGQDGIRECLKFLETMTDRRCYPGIRFFKAALEECVRTKDVRGATLLWGAMTGRNGLAADTDMYNSMIELHCRLRDLEAAKDLLDEMVVNGAFPDHITYNTVFHSFLLDKKLREASCIFAEMVKNECLPSHSNCCLAINVFMDKGDAYMAIKIWKWMVENYRDNLSDTGNFLVMGLRDINRVPEAVKYAEDMIDRSIKLNSATLTKLKHSLTKAGKVPVYDELLKKWKFR